MIVALTGASGFIGQALSRRLLASGHTVLPVKMREGQAVPECDAAVHLAGEPVAQRWTDEAKRRIRESRVEGTRRVVSQLSERTRVFVCGCATGIYGSGFLADVCREWEQAADEAARPGRRVVKLRTGIVLGPGGGALERMLPAFRLGAGGRLGSGEQWMSWIHIDDVAGLIEFALNHECVEGPLDAAAPNPVTNAEFTRELARALNRPAAVRVPAFVLRLIFGEMASVLLEGPRVLPAAALEAGYRFRYPVLGPALREIIAAIR
ncbi:MAG: TIGR01777 family oxidoreductase [Acidobacteriota bacterium]